MEGKSFYFGGAGLHDATIVNGNCEKSQKLRRYSLN